MLVFFGRNQTSLRGEAQGGRVRSVRSEAGKGYGKTRELWVDDFDFVNKSQN